MKSSRTRRRLLFKAELVPKTIADSDWLKKWLEKNQITEMRFTVGNGDTLTLNFDAPGLLPSERI